MIVAPPFEAGPVKATLACVLPAVARPMVGAPGTVAGVTLTGAEAAPVPIALVAVTVHATVAPLVRPAMTSDRPVPAALCDPQVAV